MFSVDNSVIEKSEWKRERERERVRGKEGAKEKLARSMNRGTASECSKHPMYYPNKVEKKTMLQQIVVNALVKGMEHEKKI